MLNALPMANLSATEQTSVHEGTDATVPPPAIDYSMFTSSGNWPFASAWQNFLMEEALQPLPSTAANALHDGHNAWDALFALPNMWDQPDARSPTIMNFQHASLSTPGSCASRSTETPAVLASGIRATAAYDNSFWNSIVMPDGSSQGRALSEFLLAPKITQSLPSLPQSSPGTRPQFILPQARERLLELVIGQCPKENLLQIVSVFPSLEALQVLVETYLRFHSSLHTGWIHFPTWDCNTVRTELLAAVVAAGACVTSVREIQHFGAALAYVVKEAIGARWDKDVVSSSRVHSQGLQLLQSYLIVFSTWFWTGLGRKLRLSEKLEMSFVIVIRMCRYSRRSYYTPIAPQAADSSAMVEGKWLKWAEQESLKRLVHAFFVHDAQMSMMHLINPLMSVSEMELPLYEAESVWTSRSAVHWKAEIMSQTHQSASMTDSMPGSLISCVRQALSRQLLSCSCTTTSLLLYGLWSHVWSCRQDHDIMYNGLDNTSEGLLVSSRANELANTIQAIPVTNGDSKKTDSKLLMISAFLSLALYTPLPALQKFLGRYGDQEAQDAAPLLHDWMLGRNSRYALNSAARILHSAHHMGTPYLHGFSAYAVYTAGLTLFCYGVMVTTQARKTHIGHNALRSAQTMDSSPTAWLGGIDDDAAQVQQAFLASGYGVPAIRLQNGVPAAYIHQPESIIALVVSIFTRQGTLKLDGMPGFTENLVRILQSLANSAAARELDLSG
ncbi:Transcription factor, fungi [Penicillium italicum]|uniref:Transcription factor, fungi n=1 Tax=Penicillium italicum TaxID=40296 RepID=A0A0A2K709_PENIT|nr:Transcription factor, fungi [Penicillium italicum]